MKTKNSFLKNFKPLEQISIALEAFLYDLF